MILAIGVGGNGVKPFNERRQLVKSDWKKFSNVLK